MEYKPGVHIDAASVVCRSLSGVTAAIPFAEGVPKKKPRANKQRLHGNWDKEPEN